jgi:acetyltransferase-like isoleucine patch superfamily enzyme
MLTPPEPNAPARPDSSYYAESELAQLGFRQLGANVLISRFARIYSPETISVGNHVRIDDFCVLSGGAGIVLGNYVHVAAFCALYGAASIVLEDFSGLSARVTVYTASDDYSGKSLTNPTVPARFKPLGERAPVLIKRHAIVGTNSTIMPGVTIGEGAAVGAHSFVTKDCQEWGVYFGSPAKRIGARSRDLLELERQFLSGSAGEA